MNSVIYIAMMSTAVAEFNHLRSSVAFTMRWTSKQASIFRHSIHQECKYSNPLTLVLLMCLMSSTMWGHDDRCCCADASDTRHLNSNRCRYRIADIDSAAWTSKSDFITYRMTVGNKVSKNKLYLRAVWTKPRRVRWRNQQDISLTHVAFLKGVLSLKKAEQ